MPSIVVYGLNKDRDIKWIADLYDRHKELPVYKDESVINIINDSFVIDTKGIYHPYAVISGSLEMTEESILRIANHFISLINIEVYSPTKGIKAFRKRGEYFPINIFSLKNK